MDENTARLMEFMMMLFGLQTTIILAAFGFMWKNINTRLTKIEDKINDIDKRLVAVETLLHMKECCMLKDEKKLRKAE